MNDQDQNSARARFIRSNRKARGFNSDHEHAVKASDSGVPDWLRNAAIGAVALLVVVVGWSIVSGGDESTEILLTSAPDYEIGTCFDAASELWLASSAIKNCYEPHIFEVVGAADLTDLFIEYPDIVQLRTAAERQCAIDLAERTALSTDSGYKIGASLPDAAEWAQGQRGVLCSLSNANGALLSLPIELPSS